MDGSDVRTVISLNSASNIDYAFVFTLDHSRQLLYWVNHNIDSCYYSIESSSANDGSERTVHSTPSFGCHYPDKQAIDFFRGVIYYSRDIEDYLLSHHHTSTVFKIMVEHTPNITTNFVYVRQYVCHISNIKVYAGIKVISPERQLQGSIPAYNLKA